jgi:aminotransferase MxcL
MDEVVTGFRLALGGAQEYYQVQADLVTLSKSLAGGMPLSAITGPAELMEPMAELQVSTTFGGEMLSLEVCKAVLLEYQRSGYIEHIHHIGAQLKQGINAAAEQLEVPLRVVGYDPVSMFMFDRDMAVHAGYAEIFLGEMAERGVLLRRDVNFICALHTQPQIAHTIDAASASLYAMRERGVFDTQGGVD